MPEPKLPPNRRPSQTKIVATIGPACEKIEQLVELIHVGVDVFRVNTVHGSREEHQRRVDDVRRAGREAGQPVAILVDLAGPKIRLGELPGGTLQCVSGQFVRFIRGEQTTKPGDLVTTYGPLVDELAVGDRVLLADGLVALVVERVEPDAVTCHVIQSGQVRSRQGVNLPGVKLSVPTLGLHDRDNAVWAARAGVDFLGLSFVRSAADVRQLQSLIADQKSTAQVVAKIEKPEAVEQIEEIVQAADAVMVARGDLGVEIDIAEVPVVQKRIIGVAHRLHKPVIIATQMLESMHHSRIPTRAEATDVANAILDGADACMLSGETAVGEYPREAVEMMHRIALSTEPLVRERAASRVNGLDPTDEDPITEATAMAAGRLAEAIDARMVLVATASGRTALRLSKDRLFVPTVGVSDSDAALRRMCLYWGVIPLAGVPTGSPSEMMEHVVAKAREAGYLAPGDRVVLLAGTGLKAAEHNMIVIHELES
ncbi:MAG TPA: pyruvate kinase [Thermoguttaceae bacterium]|nr:pyruvate kinase [Thermoguttaceae bacterium]